MIHCLLDRALSPSLSSFGFYSFRLLSALVISPSTYFPPSIILVLSRIFFFISPLEFPSFTLDRSKVSYILSFTLWSSLLSLLTSLHIELLHFPTYVNFSYVFSVSSFPTLIFLSLFSNHLLISQDRLRVDLLLEFTIGMYPSL